MTRRCVWVLAFLLLSGCAARAPSPQLVADLGKARALVAAGCYTCLTDALDIYERVVQSPRAPLEAHRGAFETAVLLVVRSKELGLPEEPPMTRARTLAARVPATAAPTLPAAALLDAAALVAGEYSGLDPDMRERLTRDRRSAYGTNITEHPARLALTPAIPSDLLAAYLALAIDCYDARARKAVNAQQVLAQHGSNLMRYRLAMCALGSDSLDVLRAADPRWQDTLFFEGRREMTRQPVPEIGLAADLFTQAYRAFPASAAVTMALAKARNALSEFETALTLFDTVLAESPTHRDALLGRVMSLSYLNRHSEAIATASELIALGRWHVGDAYYWRAWNRYRQTELDAAWTDIEQATKLNIDTAVYLLAGIIAYARKDLDTAIARLDRAFALDNTNCEAVWTEGLVHADKQAWAPSASRFSRSVTCFTAAAAQAQRDMATAQTATSESTRARLMALAQKARDTAEHRRAQSAYNAASSYLRLGEKDAALTHVDVAVEHVLLKDKAAELKKSIEKLP